MDISSNLLHLARYSDSTETGRENVKKISLFIYSFSGGGAEKVMVTLANKLFHRGYNIEILVVDPTGPCSEEIDPGIEVSSIEDTNFLKTIYVLWNQLRQSKTDILISTMEMPNIIAIISTHIPRTTPIIIQCVSVNSNRKRSGKYRFIPLLKRITYPWADEVVTVSDGVAQDIAETTKMSVSEMTTIYNPIYTPEIHEKMSEKVNHPWLSKDDSPVVLGVGRMTPAKDFPTLLRAVAQLEEDIRLVILGRGPDKESLKALARDLEIGHRVSFPGFVDNPYAYMAKADVFVLSSAWEGFGNVLVEAMACGTPVVSTDCPGGPAEILEHGQFGPLIPVGDHEAMATAIRETLRNPIDSKALQTRAGDFNIESIIDEYEEVLTAVVN